MESTGVPGRVQVTRETYERLRDAFEFERRGLVDVKGKGRVETWFLLGRRTGATVETAAAAAQAPG
jgi:class 3 adenylate cyclase